MIHLPIAQIAVDPLILVTIGMLVGFLSGMFLLIWPVIINTKPEISSQKEENPSVANVTYAIYTPSCTRPVNLYRPSTEQMPSPALT